ncbi:hemolysin family protein [Streptomyces somaliensis]|uniref:hemolysin family protein n=1 Tax=Streptomyces somaliensis TaxID=78355 RepID=UPI0020CF160F|nr:hemolysin family protein [Streptomyces somaliensis]MCP9946528.1 hemolysin family protein [Streptomyces somaliensis]MCP9960331.1 hemolysin family protein [Streptomyces somaliensis]MCP9973102.1 hemolysin family protein [Streptomyces somaliensis]
MTVPLLLLCAAFLLILANGFFVAAEFGLVTVERADAERAASDGDRRARTVVRALSELSFQLSGTQLGITLTSLVVGMLAQPALAGLLSGPLTAAGLPRGAVSGTAVGVGMLAASALQMVVGELVPKNWAVSRPLQVARFVAGPQYAFSAALRPVIALLNAVANRMVRLMGVEPAEELASARTPGELVALVRHSARAGALEQDTADLFVRTLSLGGLTAQHVMTPRVKVSALHADATAADVLNLTRATGLSRFPVYRDRLDEVVGTVHLKDALAVPAPARPRTPVGGIAVPPLLVPETLPVQALLERLRSEQPIAVVVDEYGGTAGVVTLEDIVEELVGEVRDEHDGAADDGPGPVPVAPEEGRPAWEADGSCRVHELRRMGLEVPDGPYETVAGLVADLLGRIPAPGDRAELPGWRLLVRRVDRYRAERVRLVRTADVPEAVR